MSGRYHAIYRMMFLLALACLGLGGCNSPLQGTVPSGETGMIRVQAGTGGRTLVPTLPSIDLYRFSFESPGRNPVVKDSSGAFLEQELSAGTWTLTVTALVGSGLKEVARGSARVVVLAGKTSSVTVQLGNEPGSEPGVLRYTVEFPITVSEASLALVSMDGRGSSALEDLLEGSVPISGGRKKTGLFNAPAGNYQLVIDLYGSAGNAGKIEIVHLYSNTEISGIYSFDVQDFNPTLEYSTGSGASLSEVLTAIGSEINDSDFTILMNGNEFTFAPFTLDNAKYGGKTLRIRGKRRTITLDEGRAGSLFTLEPGVTLVLQDVTLQGRGAGFENSRALITVAGGELLTGPGTIITENSSSSNNYGGGVFVGSGTFTMNGGSITGNTATYSGGGGVSVDSGTFTMSGGSIMGNSAAIGGVSVGSGTFTMNGGSIIGNASFGSAGVVVVFGGGTFTMNGGSIAENTSSAYGGGVYVDGTFTMRGGSITGNTATYSGGVCVSGGTFTMSGGSITGNSGNALSGGVYVQSGTFTMSGGSITGNIVPASAYGSRGSGGVYMEAGTFTMNGGSIAGNSATNSGGVHVGSGTFEMSGGSITGNIASANSGGVHVGSGTFEMSGGSITGNIASTNSGGVYVGSGTFTMSGGSIAGNSAYGVYVVGGNGATFTMSNNARIDPSNTVFLFSGSSIIIAGGFTGSDTVAVLDLDGSAVGWLGKIVLRQAAGYTGAIPGGRFELGSFVTNAWLTITPIGDSYIIDSVGKFNR
jgi:hypothetical protein